MTTDEQIAMDSVADRLGGLYQLIGRIAHNHAIDDDSVTVALNEILALTQKVERISDRVQRHDDQCH